VGALTNLVVLQNAPANECAPSIVTPLHKTCYNISLLPIVVQGSALQPSAPPCEPGRVVQRYFALSATILQRVPYNMPTEQDRARDRLRSQARRAYRKANPKLLAAYRRRQKANKQLWAEANPELAAQQRARKRAYQRRWSRGRGGVPGP